MNRIFVFLFLSFSLLLLANPIAGKSIDTFGILAIPVGDFGADSGNNAGMAELGYGLGIDIQFQNPFLVDLPILFSFILMINGFDESGIESQLGGEFEARSWHSVPVLLGMKKESQLSNDLELQLFGQVGSAFIKPPDLEKIPLRVKWYTDSYTSFAFCLGGSIVLKDKYHLSLRYMNFGNVKVYEIIRTCVQEECVSFIGEEKQPISIVAISAGVSF